MFSQHQSPFTDPSKQDASSGHHFSSMVQPANKQSSKQSKRSKISLKTDSGLPYEADLQRQLYDLQLPDEQAELLTSPPLYEGLPFPDKSDPQSFSRPAATERDLSQEVRQEIRQEIRLVELQKEKLTLELEVLRLHHSPISASDDHPAQTSSGEKPTSSKKRVIDWPHEFAPSNPSDYDKIELAEFVTGFLAMIKPYDNPPKEVSHARTSGAINDEGVELFLA